MSITPLTFTGVSTYSNDFQTVLSRGVQIASLPLKALQNRDSDTIQRKQLLGSFNSGIAALGASIAGLGTIATGQAISATSSNAAKVSVVNSGAKSAAIYTISQITSVASAASETSLAGYADASATPVSSTGTVKLVSGSNSYTLHLTPQTNNLVGLRDAINNLGAGVTASILTTGTGANGNFLSISANSTGATTLQLRDDPTGANANLLTATNQGTNSVFKLNDISVSKPGTVINDVVSGAIFTILQPTVASETVTLSLASDPTQLSSAIQDFAAKYNSLVDSVNAQTGPNAGLLSGDFLVRQLQTGLRQLTNYQGTGTIKNLSDLGIQLSTAGKITFDPTVFSALSNTQIGDAFKFFGSATTGFGALSGTFTQLSDPVTGLIKVQQDGYDSTDKQLQSQIAVLTLRISQFQTSLAARLQKADSLLAGLESQQKVLTGSLQSLSFVLFGKQVQN